jgi:hypothetical protein
MIAREHGAVRVGMKQHLQPTRLPATPTRGAELAATSKRKHAELIAEAAGVASEFGTDVCIYVARDGTGGSCHKFPGRPGHQQAAATIRQLVGKDVARMGLQEAKAHEARLLELRAAVVRKLHDIETARATAAARTNEIIRLE